VPDSLRTAASRWRSSSKSRASALGRRDIELPSLDDTHRHLIESEKRCYLCGAPIGLTKRTKLHMDHKVPLSRGGGAGLENLGISCAACDGAKGPLRYDEFSSLLGLLSTWEDQGAAQSLLLRLRGSFWVYRSAKPLQNAQRRSQEPRIDSDGLERLLEVTEQPEARLMVT
jgi:hypothetical protein